MTRTELVELLTGYRNAAERRGESSVASAYGVALGLVELTTDIAVREELAELVRTATARLVCPRCGQAGCRLRNKPGHGAGDRLGG